MVTCSRRESGAAVRSTVSVDNPFDEGGRVTEPNTPVLSVRGEARRTVSPDSVLLPGALAASGGLEPDAPSLDPVPQELMATIEARFTTTGISLVEA